MWGLPGMSERKFVQTVQVTWPKWPQWPYLIKTLQIFSSLEHVSRVPWNWVCSIGDLGPLQFVQMMTGLTLTNFAPRSNLVTYAFVWVNCMGKIIIFSKIIVRWELWKFDIYNQLNGYKRPGSVTDLEWRSLRYKKNKAILRTAGQIEAKVHMKPLS